MKNITTRVKVDIIKDVNYGCGAAEGAGQDDFSCMCGFVQVVGTGRGDAAGYGYRFGSGSGGGENGIPWGIKLCGQGDRDKNGYGCGLPSTGSGDRDKNGDGCGYED